LSRDNSSPETKGESPAEQPESAAAVDLSEANEKLSKLLGDEADAPSTDEPRK